MDNATALEHVTDSENFGKQLPPLSEDTRALLALSEDDKTNPKVLGLIVNKDPMYLARLLTYANSAYFGKMEPVHTVDMAIRRVGVDATYGLLVSCALLNITGSHPGVKPFSNFLLRYSLSQVMTAKKLAHWLELSQEDSSLLWLGCVMTVTGICGALVYGNPLRKPYEVGIGRAVSGQNYQLSNVKELSGYLRLSALVAKEWGAQDKIIVALEDANEGAPDLRLAQEILAVEKLVDSHSKKQDSSELLETLLASGAYGRRPWVKGASINLGVSFL